MSQGVSYLGFCFKMDRIHIICFVYLCSNVFVLYFMSVVLGVGSASLWWGGGSLSPVCMVYLGGFPAWGHFSNLGLGTGSFMPGELCPVLLFGSAGGGSVALEHFLTSGVWLLERVDRCDVEFGNIRCCYGTSVIITHDCRLLVTCGRARRWDELVLALVMLGDWRVHKLWRKEILHKVFCYISSCIRLCFVEKQYCVCLLWITALYRVRE